MQKSRYKLLKELDRDEERLLLSFSNSEFIKSIESMSEKDLREFLVQKRFHSHYFTLIYDHAIDCLVEGGMLKSIARDILREEYPSNEASHREHLVNDLLIVGFEHKDIVRSSETKATRDTYLQVRELLSFASGSTLELEVATILRLWAEVLVSIEYLRIAERLSDWGLTKANSMFYWPHYYHDKKKYPIHKAESVPRNESHSDLLASAIAKRIDCESDAQCVLETSRKVLDIKYRFYEQFRV